MKQIKSMTINNNQVKLITLDKIMFWNQKVKNYVYYFESNVSKMTFNLIKFGRGNDGSFEFDVLPLNKGTHLTPYIYYYLYNDYTIIIYASDNNPVTIRTIGEINYNYLQERHRIKFETEGEKTVKYYLNEELMGVSNNDLINILHLKGIVNEYGNACFHGYVYGFWLNGKKIDLVNMPGAKFENVIRYELDDNGEIIESTATTLNT